MPAPRKRFAFSKYLLLPLVVVVVSLLVAKLAALQRADRIAELAHRIAHERGDEAAVAVRQLAAMPRPPMTILVSAVAYGDRSVALESQRAISRVLRRWQRHIEADKHLADVSHQLSELAECLQRERSVFARRDYRWLASTTNKVLRLANRMPPQYSPLVAAHCDSVLAHVAAIEAPRVEVAALDGEGGLARERAEDSVDASMRHEHESVMTPIREAALSVRESRESAGAPGAGGQSLNSAWRARWSPPIFQIVPAIPIEQWQPDSSEPLQKPAGDEEAPAQPEAEERPFATTDPGRLNERWASHHVTRGRAS